MSLALTLLCPSYSAEEPSQKGFPRPMEACPKHPYQINVSSNTPKLKVIPMCFPITDFSSSVGLKHNTRDYGNTYCFLYSKLMQQEWNQPVVVIYDSVMLGTTQKTLQIMALDVDRWRDAMRMCWHLSLKYLPPKWLACVPPWERMCTSACPLGVRSTTVRMRVGIMPCACASQPCRHIALCMCFAILQVLIEISPRAHEVVQRMG